MRARRGDASSNAQPFNYRGRVVEDSETIVVNAGMPEDRKNAIDHGIPL